MRPGIVDDSEQVFPIDGGVGDLGPRSAGRLLRAGPHASRFAKGMTALRVAARSSTRRRRSEELRGLLGQMLFSGEEGMKPTDALSGGEAARLIFCRLMLQKPNFLVLDEPTNHLDLESINALNIALQKYDGHGAAGHARSRSDRRSGHAHLALRARQDRRLQGPVLRIPKRHGQGQLKRARVVQ